MLYIYRVCYKYIQIFVFVLFYHFGERLFPTHNILKRNSRLSVSLYKRLCIVRVFLGNRLRINKFIGNHCFSAIIIFLRINNSYKRNCIYLVRISILFSNHKLFIMFGFADHNDEQTEDKNTDIIHFLTEKFESFDARFDKLEGRVNSLAHLNNQERFSLAVEEEDNQKSNGRVTNLRDSYKSKSLINSDEDGNNKTIYLDEISVKAFVRFCKEVHILQVKNKGRVSISSFISNRVINFLIKRGSLYYYGLDGAMFKNLSLGSIQRLMRQSMKDNCKDDFISTVDKLVQFPRLPRGFLLSVYGFELFYKALCEYMRCFLELVQFFVFDEACHPPMLNNRRGSLLHVFMNKIPFNYGHQCLKQLGRERFTSVYEMVDEFLSIWNTDARRANEVAWTSVDEDFAVEVLAVSPKEIENCSSKAEVVSDNRSNFVSDAQSTDSNLCEQYGQAVSNVSITEDQTVKVADTSLLHVAPIESSPALFETADSNSKTIGTNESYSDLSSCQFVGFQASRGNSSDAVSIIREVFSVCKTFQDVIFVGTESLLVYDVLNAWKFSNFNESFMKKYPGLGGGFKLFQRCNEFVKEIEPEPPPEEYVQSSFKEQKLFAANSGPLLDDNLSEVFVLVVPTVDTAECALFDEVFKRRGYFVYAYGSVKKFDTNAMVLLDKKWVKQFPKLLPNDREKPFTPTQDPVETVPIVAQKRAQQVVTVKNPVAEAQVTHQDGRPIRNRVQKVFPNHV